MKQNSFLYRCAWLIGVSVTSFAAANAQSNPDATDYLPPPSSLPSSPLGSPSILATPSNYHNIALHRNTNFHQSEPSITIYPRSTNNLFVATNTATPFNAVTRQVQGTYTSSNTGSQWSGSDDFFGSADSALFDPAVGVDTVGNIFYSFIRVTNFANPVYRLYVKRYLASTGTWGPDSQIHHTGYQPDKPHVTIDVNSSSPFKNYAYLGWTDFTRLDIPPLNPVYFQRSTNGGQSFSDTLNISGRSGYDHAQGVNLSVGPRGELFATWAYYDAAGGKETGLGFNRSYDGGQTWTGAFRIPFQSGTFFGTHGRLSKADSINVHSFPWMDIDRTTGPNRGTIYLAWSNGVRSTKPQNPDIMMIKSKDSGSTWLGLNNVRIDQGGQLIKVNNDNTQTHQWFPSVNVDQYGAVNVVFYDSRIDSTNNKLTQVYMARSVDGAQTFPNYQISDTAYTPAKINGYNVAQYYAGDYIGITSNADYAFPCWNDNRTIINYGGNNYGVHQLYTARFGIFTVNAPIIGYWNMASVPDTVFSFKKTDVWPTATTVAKYWDTTTGQYAVRDTLKCGEGYFVKFGTDQTITYIGAPIRSETLKVACNAATCWNLFGSISGPVATSAVGQIPPGIVTGNYFTYGRNGYQVISTISPGLGVWVQVTQSGKLTLTNNGIPKAEGILNLLAELDRFKVTDAVGQRQDMFVSNGSRPLGKVEGGASLDGDIQMPPDPPDGLLSAHFKTGNYVQTVYPGKSPTELPIVLKSAVYPVTLSWMLDKANDVEYWLALGDQRISLSGSSSITVHDVGDHVLHLSAQAGAVAPLPQAYSLSQNYPNPFNPTTTVRYALPLDSKVILRVYNTLGQEVRKLADRIETTGYKSVNFEASNLPSGIYFYRLDAASVTDPSRTFSQVKKAVFLK